MLFENNWLIGLHIPAELLPFSVLWTANALFVLVLLAAATQSPVKKLLANTPSQHVYFGAMVALLLLWGVKAGISPGLGFHHLGAILDGVVNVQIKPGNDRPKSPPVMDGTWHHVAVTADFGAKTQNAHAYIDGRRVNAVDGRFLKSFNRPNAGAKFVIGARSPGGAYPFRGSLDDVRFYDRALSKDEILALFEGHIFLFRQDVLQG